MPQPEACASVARKFINMAPATGASFRSRALSSQRQGEQRRNLEIPPTSVRVVTEDKARYQLWPTPESDSEVTALPHLRRKRSTTIPRTAGTSTLSRGQVNDLSWPLYPGGPKKEQNVVRKARQRIEPGKFPWRIFVAFN